MGHYWKAYEMVGEAAQRYIEATAANESDGEQNMIKGCTKCGGLYVTQSGESFVGTPCSCVRPSRYVFLPMVLPLTAAGAQEWSSATPAPVPVIEAPQGEQEVVFRWGKDADGYPILVPTMESSTVTTSEVARETAIKLSTHFGLRFGEASLAQAAAIISKHFDAGAVEQSLRAEVEHWVNHYNELDAWRAQTTGINAQLRAELSTARNEIQRLESELTIPRCNECGAVLGDNWCADCAGRADRERLADARANAIREAVKKIGYIRMKYDGDDTLAMIDEIIIALQSLLDKKEGDDDKSVE